MPKFTTEEIEADIAKLEAGGFLCAVYYLKIELKRRKASQINKGRPIKDDSEQRQKWREASERYRNKHERRGEKK